MFVGSLQAQTGGYGETLVMAGMPTMQERLDMAVKQAEERLAAVTRARDILARNPDIEELLNIMQKSQF